MPAHVAADHPGQKLQRLLDSSGITATAFADHVGVGRNIVSRVLNGRSDISPAMALRISAAFGGDAMEWISLQGAHDLRVAETELKSELKQIKRIRPAKDSAGHAPPEGRGNRR